MLSDKISFCCVLVLPCFYYILYCSFYPYWRLDVFVSINVTYLLPLLSWAYLCQSLFYPVDGCIRVLRRMILWMKTVGAARWMYLNCRWNESKWVAINEGFMWYSISMKNLLFNLQYCTLTIVYLDVVDPPTNIRRASCRGFGPAPHLFLAMQRLIHLYLR